MSALFLGVDLGSSGLRLAVLAEAGAPGGQPDATLLSRQSPYPGRLEEPGAWLQGLIELLATVILGTFAVVGLASLSKWMTLRAGGPAVAEMVGGRRANPQTTDLRERQLLNVVEEMAIASGVPLPAVYLLDDEPGLNAFAAGLGPSDAVVAVTRGALEKFTRDELQAVVGHEFSHILNGDMRHHQLELLAVVVGDLLRMRLKH